MTKMNGILRSIALTACLACPVALMAQTYAIRNVRIVTVSGETIPSGTILIRDGKIQAVGARVSVPSNVQTIDASGLTAYPGMIDPHTAIGLAEITSVSATQDTTELGDVNPHVKASAAINPLSEHIAVARTNGITTVVSAPRGGLFSGQGAIINLNGSTTKEMTVKDAALMVINYPADVRPAANATERQRRDAEDARKKRIDLLKKTLRDAQAYAKLVSASADVEPNPVLQSLVPVVNGTMSVLLGVNTVNEIKGALELTEEFKLKTILRGAAEAGKAVNLLKGKNVPVLLGGITDLPSSDLDPYDINYAAAAALFKAGVKFAFTTDEVAHVRDLPFLAGMAAAFGLPKEEALRAVTLYPAQILGISDRVGSIEEGKVANIVVADGDPLEHATKLKYLFIDGKPVELTNRHTELYEEFLKAR